MKLNVSVALMGLVVVLAIGATTFRVSTAPERIRQRIDAAKAACVGAGGQWVRVDRDEVCQTAGASSRP